MVSDLGYPSWTTTNLSTDKAIVKLCGAITLSGSTILVWITQGRKMV